LLIVYNNETYNEQYSSLEETITGINYILNTC
jgi:hypothetical protein